ncbi:hypothetical protein I3760_13G147700 [Carya illinoinensis]|nr:hypothetical protein I3760_13G147700 [Carya illinoinensis]
MIVGKEARKSCKLKVDEPYRGNMRSHVGILIIHMIHFLLVFMCPIGYKCVLRSPLQDFPPPHDRDHGDAIGLMVLRWQ